MAARHSNRVSRGPFSPAFLAVDTAAVTPCNASRTPPPREEGAVRRVEALQQVWSECLPIELQLAPAVCIRSGSRARERSARRHVAAAAADGRGGGD